MPPLWSSSWYGNIFSTAACSFPAKAILTQTPTSPKEPSPFMSLLPLTQQGGFFESKLPSTLPRQPRASLVPPQGFGLSLAELSGGSARNKSPKAQAQSCTQVLRGLWVNRTLRLSLPPPQAVSHTPLTSSPCLNDQSAPYPGTQGHAC